MGKKTKMTATDALKILENAQGKDFYTTEYQEAMNIAVEALRDKVNPAAHWIFSGDKDDYDGYYINCSKCGVQRKAYDRDYDLDVPTACPHCGTPMDLTAWEVHDIVQGGGPNDKILYQVVVIHDNGTVKRPYVMNVKADSEASAKQKALFDVTSRWLPGEKVGGLIYVHDIVEV